MLLKLSPNYVMRQARFPNLTFINFSIGEHVIHLRMFIFYERDHKKRHGNLLAFGFLFINYNKKIVATYASQKC